MGPTARRVISPWARAAMPLPNTSATTKIAEKNLACLTGSSSPQAGHSTVRARLCLYTNGGCYSQSFCIRIATQEDVNIICNFCSTGGGQALGKGQLYPTTAMASVELNVRGEDRKSTRLNSSHV